jgi:Predicted AAA-ATPase
MLKFPYAVCDFYSLITENYFYVDRTAAIPRLEDAGKHLLFLRPRRFGKSLLVSMLENYYDVAKADQFEKLFGHLAIGKQPTPKHNQYFVLKWDFSAVKPKGDAQDLERALDNYVNARIQNFAQSYQHLLPVAIPLEPHDAMVSFQYLLTAVQQTPYRLYLLIDEYDNFANELMMAPPNANPTREAALRAGESALKAVLKVVKAASAGGGLDRAFLTGISPVILTDITSGYNIARNIYLDADFHDLCGFTETEMATVLTQLGQECGWSPDTTTGALTTMRQFYNGYRFSDESPELQQLQPKCQAPKKLLDSNLMMDRNKLTFLSHLPDGETVLFSALGEHPPLTIPELTDRFGIEEFLKPSLESTLIISLLYYFGVLTFAGPPEIGRVVLTIPNLAVRKLYVEQLRERLLPGVSTEVAQLAHTCHRTGDLQPVCEFMEQRYFKVLDNRDYAATAKELALKLAFLTVLFNDAIYVMDSETALERSYADLTMRVRDEARGAGFWDFLLEFKFVNLKPVKLSNQRKLTGKAVKQMTVADLKTHCQSQLTEATEQLRRYRQTLVETYGEKLRLKVFAVVAVGWERVVWEEV